MQLLTVSGCGRESFVVRLEFLSLNQKESSVLKSQLIFLGNGVKTKGLFRCDPTDKWGKNNSQPNSWLRTSPSLVEKGNDHYFFFCIKNKEQLSPSQRVEVSFQPCTRWVNKSREKEKKALAVRVCMIYVLLTSAKSLARTSSYYVHSHRHRPHYLLFFSMKFKCLLYQNIHLK